MSIAGRNAIALLGVGLIAVGLYQAYPPLAWIVGGLAMLWALAVTTSDNQGDQRR